MRSPGTLALIDGDATYSKALCAHLAGLGVRARHFRDSSDLIAEPSAFGFEFYVFDLAVAGVDGIEMIRILRRRTNAGIVVVSDRLRSEVFDDAIVAGADMYLAKPAAFEQVALAVRAVHRRIASAQTAAQPWKLDKGTAQLITPSGQRVPLSGTDFAMLECFVEAAGAAVSREALRARIGGSPPDNLLPAAIYRMRSRIERVTSTSVPLRSQQRVGYVFRAPLCFA